MKTKTKLFTCVVMAILVMSMLVVGVFAVKTASFDIGGSIVFNANGIEAVISAGTLNYDEAYVDISDKGNVMQEVVLSTDTSKDTSSKMSTWSGLKLKFNENGDDVVISFSVTNVSTRENDYLSVSIEVPTTSTSDNINITINPESSSLAPNIGETPENTQSYTITFSVINKEINAKLDNFAIKVGLEQVKEASSYEEVLTFTCNDLTSKAEVKFKDAYTEDKINSEGFTPEFKRGTGANLTIPAYVKNNDKVYAVTSIANAGFAFCTELKSVHLPNTIESIGVMAFCCCGSEEMVGPGMGVNTPINSENSGLEQINIPDGLTSIGYRAFFGCTGLNSIIIPDEVTSIGAYAFYLSGLTSITIPDRVTSIGDHAFADCSGLTTVVIDSPDVASGLTSQTSMGYLIDYAEKVYVKEGLTAGSYLTDVANFTRAETSDKAGYVLYNKVV